MDEFERLTMIRYIYNTSGNYVAFIAAEYLFTPNAKWIGVVANGNEIYNTQGLFVGWVASDDRVVKSITVSSAKWIPNPQPPPFQIAPVSPMRRLKMPKVQYPYIDVFSSGPKNQLQSNVNVTNYGRFTGASIEASDGTFLGIVSKDVSNPKSIANQFGKYGSPLSEVSIFNKLGTYGSALSPMSAFNDYATAPPKLMKGKSFMGFLSTSNMTIRDRVDPNELVAWLNMSQVAY